MKAEHQISNAIHEQAHILAEQVVELQYNRQPHLWTSFGPVGREKSVRDAKYHFSYLIEAIRAEDPSLFADYVAWVKVLFANLNFPDEAMIVNLECMRDVFREHLPADMIDVINEYIEAGLQQMRQAPSTIPTCNIPERSPLNELATHYIEALLKGERLLPAGLF